jgi:hypothetical protein
LKASKPIFSDEIAFAFRLFASRRSFMTWSLRSSPGRYGTDAIALRALSRENVVEVPSAKRTPRQRVYPAPLFSMVGKNAVTADGIGKSVFAQYRS